MSFSIILIAAALIVGVFIVCGVVVAVLAATSGRPRE